MTVLPVPVTPPAPADAAPASDPPAPGFANLLADAQSSSRPAAQASNGETGNSGDDRAKSSDPKSPPHALSDATVLALLAALASPAVTSTTPTPTAASTATTTATPAKGSAPAGTGAPSGNDVVAVVATTNAADSGAATAAAVAPVTIDLTAGAGALPPVPATSTPASPTVTATPTPKPTPTADTAKAAVPAPNSAREGGATATPTGDDNRSAAGRATDPTIAVNPAHHAQAAPAVAVPATTPNAPTPTATPALTRVDAASATTNAAPASSAPATPAPAPPPAEQLVASMRPLQRASDGSYQLRLELRPPELGRVDVRVEIRDGVMHATIHTEHAHTADLMRNALDDLRARLDADGVRSGSLTVGDDGRGAMSRDPNARPEGTEPDQPTAAETPAPPASDATDPDALLDVRI